MLCSRNLTDCFSYATIEQHLVSMGMKHGCFIPIETNPLFNLLKTNNFSFLTLTLFRRRHQDMYPDQRTRGPWVIAGQESSQKAALRPAWGGVLRPLLMGAATPPGRKLHRDRTHCLRRLKRRRSHPLLMETVEVGRA